MSLEAFTAVPRKKRVVKQSTLMLTGEPVTVLTMWDGIDNAEGEAPLPLPFSTVVYSRLYPSIKLDVPDEKHARVAHEMALGFVRSQGAKGGLPLFAYFMSSTWRNPRGVRLAWVQMVLAAIVLLVQIGPLTVSVIRWDWDWADIFSASMALLWGWLFACSLGGLRDRRQDRKEERRIAADKEAFEKIVGQIES